MNTVKNSILKNFIWRFAERCGAQLVTFIVSIVLARILAPEDYGTIALVTVFTTILQVFVDSGLGTALIQKKDADDLDFSSVFFFNFTVCLILYLGMFIVAPFIAEFYNDASLTPVVRVISLTIVISGVKGIQQAYVSRHMLFKRFFFSTVGGTIFSAFLGIALAYAGFGVWALVAQQLSNTAIDTLILWLTVKWRPKRMFSWTRLKGLLKFGWKLLVSALLDTCYNNLRNLIIGKMYSSSDLAYYNQGDKKAPFNDIDFFTWPVIVKPVDSAGSKGVTKVDSPDKLAEAIETAVGGSHNGAYIIEDFLTFKGYHSSADPFTVDGELKFVSYSDQLFDKEADNPYTPAYIIWTTSMAKEDQDYLTKETQRLLTLLGMKTGIYNIETCVGSDGKPYIMEVSPRGGGCKIAELQRLAYGVDLIENEVRKAVGMPLTEIKQTECDGHWCEMVIHARPGQSGVLKGIKIDPEIEKKYVKIVDLSAKPGDFVEPFTGANMSLGDMFLRFDSREELDDVMSKSKEWLTIQLEDK